LLDSGSLTVLMMLLPSFALVVPQDAPAFGTGSPAFAAVRWLWFLSIIGVIGAVTFRFLVAGNARGLAPAVRSESIARAARVGLVSAAFAIAAAALRLVAQSIALLGEIGADVMILLTGTTWGTAWIIHAAAATAALAAFGLAVRGVPGAWALAAIAVPGLAASPSLSGHAAAVQSLQPIPIVADILHVAAGGTWIGGLLVLFAAGLPAARSDGPLGGHFDRLVAAFSPIALASAAIILATGAFASLIHIGSPADLITTRWGQLLTLKIAAALAVAAFGARNFLRLRHGILEPAGAERLRQSAAAELAIGAIVLLVTAFLVATSPPSEERDTAMSPSISTEAGGRPAAPPILVTNRR
jgi:putative copper export protein